jgi:predicted transcriptional regulator
VLVRITFKDPNGVSNAIEQMIDARLVNVVDGTVAVEASKKAWLEEVIPNFRKFVKSRESVAIEIDTTTGQARVVPVKELAKAQTA